MTNLYNKTSERLWEKLEYHKNKIDASCVNFKEPFPIDQLVEKNPMITTLIHEVQDEYKYEMSEFQCSWAVVQFIKGGLDMMQKYNKNNNTSLIPRA